MRATRSSDIVETRLMLPFTKGYYDRFEIYIRAPDRLLQAMLFLGSILQGLLFWLFKGGFKVSSDIEAVIVLTSIILKWQAPYWGP